MCLHHHPYLDKRIRPYHVALAEYVGETSRKARLGQIAGIELLRRRRVATGAKRNIKQLGGSWAELIDILESMGH